MILNPLLIAGIERISNLVRGSSIFYPDYSYQYATAGALEAAAAIGAARRADPLPLSQRRASLESAAAHFTFSQEDLLHAVRMTGMPVASVAGLFAEIHEILREIPILQERRFEGFGEAGQYFGEALDEKRAKIFLPPEGFCYAITPGNDPRAVAIVAGNLCYLGIPFVIRASVRDAIAPRVIKALIDGGFDPRACNLVYLDRHGPLSAGTHFQLVDSSQIVWTFGPAQEIEPTLRYRSFGERINLDLSGLGYDQDNLGKLAKSLATLPPEELRAWLCVETLQEDHFRGKTVLRHAAGNCAAVVFAPWTDWLEKMLYQSLGYPLACTTTRSMMAIGDQNWEEDAAQFLASLTVGDPMDPETKVGYIEPSVLDELERLIRANRMRISVHGGTRLSPFQSTPLLVTSQDEAPDFFAREIPAYVLALRMCRDIREAVEQINRSTGEVPRLAVSFLQAPDGDLGWAIANVLAYTVLIGAPTTRLTPFLHEGNDYALQLSNSKLVVKDNKEGGSSS